MIYLYLFGTCFHFIYVFMIIGNRYTNDSNESNAEIEGISRCFARIENIKRQSLFTNRVA